MHIIPESFNDLIVILVIREYGSTLYVGMARKKMAAHTFQLEVKS